MINLKLSKQLGRQIKSQNKGCWQNALGVMLVHLPEALYIEGWVCVSKFGIAAEHGYLRFEGEIIDPTPTMWVPDNVYFDGHSYSISEIDTKIIEAQPPFVWNDHGWGGFRSAKYKAAHDAAWSKATQIASER